MLAPQESRNEIVTNARARALNVESERPQE